jgi:hypothetical protein
MVSLLFAHVRRRYLVLLAVVWLFSGVVPSVALAAMPLCKENETAKPAPYNGKGLIELQSNAARATFDVKLDSQASGSDFITFNPKGLKQPGSDALIAAEVTDVPRSNGRALGGVSQVGAGTLKSGRKVVLEACFQDVPRFTAGRYEGTVSIYGPKLADFNYAIVVTTKWPSWIAWLCIVATLVTFVSLSVISGTWKIKGPGKKAARLKRFGFWFTSLVTLVIVAGLAGGTYWTVYANNETWGANKFGDLTGLIAASFAAAAVGFKTAHGLIPHEVAEEPKKPAKPHVASP